MLSKKESLLVRPFVLRKYENHRRKVDQQYVDCDNYTIFMRILGGRSWASDRYPLPNQLSTCDSENEESPTRTRTFEWNWTGKPTAAHEIGTNYEQKSIGELLARTETVVSLLPLWLFSGFSFAELLGWIPNRALFISFEVQFCICDVFVLNSSFVNRITIPILPNPRSKSAVIGASASTMPFPYSLSPSPRSGEESGLARPADGKPIGAASSRCTVCNKTYVEKRLVSITREIRAFQRVAANSIDYFHIRPFQRSEYHGLRCGNRGARSIGNQNHRGMNVANFAVELQREGRRGWFFEWTSAT